MLLNHDPFVFRSLAARASLIILCCVFIALPAMAQAGLDLSFDAAVSREVTSDISAIDPKLAVQPDGKALVMGYPAIQNIAGKAKIKLGRLNTDGTVDNSFNCSAACANFAYVSSAVVQPDGKILIAGGGKISRLNSDGSIDGSFVYVPNLANCCSNVWAVQTDGKVLASTTYSGFHTINTALFRLNPDGSADSSFASQGFEGWFARDQLLAVMPVAGGKVMIAGKKGSDYIYRTNSDGTKDAAFESPAMTSASSPQFPPYVTDFGIQSTGKVVIIGSFNTVNGISRPGFTRLNADGSMDMSFASPASGGEGTLEVISGDRILLKVGGLTRLTSEGIPDGTFSAAYPVADWRVDSQERIVFVGSFTENVIVGKKVGRMNPDGSADNTFSLAHVGLTGELDAVAVQTDGKVLLGGKFTRLNGGLRFSLVRVNTDGTLDPSFNAGDGVPDYYLNLIVPQPDGKILLGGSFGNYNGTPRTGIARVNSDGTLDAGFNPVLTGSNTVSAIAVQTDGKILIGGSFTSVDGTNRPSLARLNSNGTLDTAFAPILGNPLISAIFLHSDGKIVIGGTFTGVNGFNRSNIARLNSDSTLDATFNAGSVSTVSRILGRADGKYFIIVNGQILRRNADGTADGTFPTLTISGSARRLIEQTDGSIVFAGAFTAVNGTPRGNIARIRSNGSLDTTFLSAGTNGVINDFAVQSDGKLILGGNFTSVEGVDRNSVARVFPSYSVRTSLFDFDGDGRADISVMRPSNYYWYQLLGPSYQFVYTPFGQTDDISTPADFDGDGKTDLGIYRPSTSRFWYRSSIDGVFRGMTWGQAGDVPLPSDINGDGKADWVIYRPSTQTWQRLTNGSQQYSAVYFGDPGDKTVIGDFDGDSRTDPAIFRPSTGVWWYAASNNGGVHTAIPWGAAGDIPAPGDFDGDGKTDAAVFRPSTGYWYVRYSSNGSANYINFGLNGDKPIAADYDGDGKTDVAVYRPSNGYWYLLRSTEGFTGIAFGISSDVPSPNSFVPQ